MQSLIPVTVVIPVKNEEVNLPNCLEALSRFYQVIVVDSLSTDSTATIASSKGAQVINFEWDGKFPKKRNWVLRNYNFVTDWVLFVDADEVVSEEFCDELSEILHATNHVGFWLNYTNYFMGKQLRHGVPQRKLACFRISAGEYERIEEDNWSNLDMEIHEHPVLNGTIGQIKATIDHRDFKGLARFLERHIDYAKWEAARYIQIRSRLETKSPEFTARQRLKYRSIEKIWFAPLYFFFTYCVKLGFLDGRAGYCYAYYKKWYFQTVRYLIRERLAE